MAIKVLIADDEPLARRGIQQLLAKHPDCTCVAECRNGKETARALHAMRPDLLFLDIQMPGFNGFQIMDGVGPAHVPVVVLVTAHDEYAVRAFDTQALDYLLKPVTQERFDRALRRARHRLRHGRPRSAAEPGLSSDAAAPATAPIVVSTPTGELVLDAGEIDWIEAVNYYAAIHALGRRHLIRESLASLEDRLDASVFMRVHRSAIVRVASIRELCTRAGDGSVIVLRDGTEIAVSRRRKTAVADRIRAL